MRLYINIISIMLLELIAACGQEILLISMPLNLLGLISNGSPQNQLLFLLVKALNNLGLMLGMN